MGVRNRLKRDNILRILEQLWRYPGKSRADLARELRLDRSTAGSLADWMIENSILREGRASAGPKGGRPPILLSLKFGYAYGIGVELTFPYIRLYAEDLSGVLLEEKEIPVDQYGPEAINLLAVELARFRNSLDQRYSRACGLAAVGIGVSGMVDPERKSILLSNALCISSPLAVTEPLEAVLGVPILLFNDAQACAWGEAHNLSKDNLVLALIENRGGYTEKEVGVGVGIVSNGNLMNGRAVTHLLQPDPEGRSVPDQDFLKSMGRSLALIVNVTGTNDIVLGGDVSEYRDILAQEIMNNISGPRGYSGLSVKVHGTRHPGWAVASGARYSALKIILNRHQFPIVSL